jgi:hypothetical protein
MPRLSVDIDVVYTPWQTPREQPLAAIAGEIDAIAGRLAKRSCVPVRWRAAVFQGLRALYRLPLAAQTGG